MSKLNYTCKSNREQRGLIWSQHINQVIKLGYVILCDQRPLSYYPEQRGRISCGGDYSGTGGLIVPCYQPHDGLFHHAKCPNTPTPPILHVQPVCPSHEVWELLSQGWNVCVSVGGYLDKMLPGEQRDLNTEVWSGLSSTDSQVVCTH